VVLNQKFFEELQEDIEILQKTKKSIKKKYKLEIEKIQEEINTEIQKQERLQVVIKER
jgi:Txe/YoeB family toxin of Txe-Axe toxin-antitoxin module